jgi:hypothetical protein
MKATKIFIALAATAAISLAAIGVAYGYYVNNQANINPNTAYKPYTTNGDFWGWFRGCLGFGPNQPCGYQPQPSGNNTIEPPSTYVPPQAPYQQYPNQDYVPYGYGHGCWGW